ncbi:cysteine hydrolase family protein [Pedobacter ginsengiterrae]|uniref:Cysteine hydrolase family protein n=1 Tax=Pedobacter ginsengiterrae TaxID=871696 RepID=A0ABP7PG07_9SPHI
MTNTFNQNFALILIDVQKAFNQTAHWGEERNNPCAEKNMAKLLSYWREKNFPVVHIQHNSISTDSPLKVGEPGHEFMDFACPRDCETIITKEVNSAFIGTNLLSQLNSMGVHRILFAGFTTDHCVSSSVRMAANYGYEVFVAADATVTFSKLGFDGQHYTAEQVHQISLVSLQHEFAEIIDSVDIIEKLDAQ